MGGYRAANKATTVEELFAALHLVKTPLNVVLAGDTSGTIGLSTTGTIPLRKGHRGTFPVPAWVPEYDWSGCVPQDQMPQALGGSEDLLVNANNVMYDMTRSPVLFHIDSAPSYRLERAREMLADLKVHDLASEAAAQLDVKVLRGRKLTPVVVAALEDLECDSVEQAARDALGSWDFVATPDSTAAAVFYLLYRKAVLAAFEDEMGGAGRAFVLALPYPYLAFDRWFADNGHPAWDDLRTPQTETRDQVLVAAFRETVAELREAQGELVGEWRWGAVHFRHFRHMFGGKKALAGTLNLPVSEVGGGWDSICKSQFDYSNEENPFRSIGGAALRMGTDLGDIEHGYWIIDTGGAGWPLSPHYSDQYELWAAGKTLPMISNWDEIQKSAAARISLRPVVK
jgi:penicillin amidase